MPTWNFRTTTRIAEDDDPMGGAFLSPINGLNQVLSLLADLRIYVGVFPILVVFANQECFIPWARNAVLDMALFNGEGTLLRDRRKALHLHGI